MKYILTFEKPKRKRAITINVKGYAEARYYAEGILNHNDWCKAEIYELDCYTPDMNDVYLLIATGKKENKAVKWTKTNYGPI